MAFMLKAWKIIVPVSLGLFVLGCSQDNSGEDTTSNPPTTTTTTGGGEPQTPMVTAAQVVEITNKRCMPCHGGAEPQEGLNLETLAGLMKGGEHGPVVVAGDAAGSKIVIAMRGGDGVKKMPPQGDPVPEDEIKMIEDWINAGAKGE